MAKKNNTAYRTKKNRKFLEAIARIEANQRQRARTAIKKRKAKIKEVKQADRLQDKYESWWLHKWCKPSNNPMPYRLVTAIKISFYRKAAEVFYEDGSRHQVSEGGRWPGKHDLQTLEVAYNEKGNLLSEVQATGCRSTGKSPAFTRGAR